MNNESDHDSDPQKPSNGNSGLWMALCFWILVILLVLAAALYFANKPKSADGYRIDHISRSPGFRGGGGLRR